MRAALISFVLSVTICAALFGGVAVADSKGSLLPQLPPAKGEQCVEPTEIMRRQHMDFILHQRDLTVHEGIRTQKHRFVNCINCHVQADAEGNYVRHTETGHFCTACHQFSAVKIDCFQCHADRPEEAFLTNATKQLSYAEMVHALKQQKSP